MPLFERRDIEQYTNSLADYLPGGCLFASAHVDSSNFRKLLRGMAGELFRANGLLKEYSEQILPDQTIKFLDEWEQTLGIPDDCFSGTGTLNDRRTAILTKLAALGVQTADDFVELAAVFGITVQVLSGIDAISFPIQFPGLFFNTAREARYTIFVVFTVPAANRFPYTFPIVFGGSAIAILECLFNKVRPANCQVIFNQI